ncbi:MFS monosaccharide transporter-like protein [Cucurbitaria berberidis CBS 394.84]|uniref:MFS monosaccharide transporter-like protein n=1 Tax=Cucurbitaria berberidis CBS 394.84 TaxID=1168544 RepID=A0A9P4GMN9_9PLEO|nr:MFS monosaccharide transporter-like protein [Cucurbitaria berberidis CBS 394.84]KAF1849238.1 MFS monosaccharide transporter-like protein [Cucurbitaria berberidis CBS 394.84]
MPEASTRNGLLENWKCLLACTLVSMSPFQYGIDFGAIGGLQAMRGFLEVFGHPDPSSPIGYNITPERQQLISSLMTLGAFLSSSSAGLFATYMGRRQCLWMASLLCCVSNVVMMTTTSLAGLYVGRLLIGIANGWFMTFSQLYIQESTPARYRGLMISVFQIWTSVGSLIGTVIDNATHDIVGRNSYIIPLGTIFIVPVFLSIGLFFIPESPRWLMLNNKQDQAHKSMVWMRPNPETVAEELAEIQAAIDAEKHTKETANFLDIWRDPVDRRRTLLAIAAVSTQAASGAMFMIAYGTYFFQMAKVGSPFMNSCILTAVGVLAIMVNSCIISKYGRRRVFLMVGLSLCGITQIIIAAVSHVNPGTVGTGKVIVGLSVIYICGYNGMVAAYAWLSGGEIPSQRLRSYTFGVAAAVGFAGAWLATFTAPYFINPEALGWGPEYGWIWGPSCFITVVWVYFYLPEIKNRTLEEIDEMFEAKLAARKFRKYVCTGRYVVDGDEKVVEWRHSGGSDKDGVVRQEVVGVEKTG